MRSSATSRVIWPLFARSVTILHHHMNMRQSLKGSTEVFLRSMSTVFNKEFHGAKFGLDFGRQVKKKNRFLWAAPKDMNRGMASKPKPAPPMKAKSQISKKEMPRKRPPPSSVAKLQKQLECPNHLPIHHQVGEEVLLVQKNLPIHRQVIFNEPKLSLPPTKTNRWNKILRPVDMESMKADQGIPTFGKTSVKEDKGIADEGMASVKAETSVKADEGIPDEGMASSPKPEDISRFPTPAKDEIIKHETYVEYVKNVVREWLAASVVEVQMNPQYQRNALTNFLLMTLCSSVLDVVREAGRKIYMELEGRRSDYLL